MGSLKTEERTTKTAEDGSTPRPPPPAPPRRRFLVIALGLLILLGAAAYNYYRAHRETTEAEVVHIEALIAAGQNDEARALMVDAQIRSRNVDALRLRVGRAFLHEGQTGPATALLSKVGGSLIKEENLAIAEYFLVSGDPFSATRFFEAAMKTGLPKTASLLDRYGQALSLSANGEGAVAAFRECLALDASRVGARLNLAATLANLGRLDEARVEAMAVLQLEPANEKALSLMAVLPGPTPPTPR
jgi:Flp pilus assembly protein TadD